MTSKFTENFWGDTNAGFDVLLQNMKAELTATKELADCLKEKALLEDQYAKGLAKMLKTVAPIQDTTVGSFFPFWKHIKETLDQQMAVHSQLSQALMELSREVLEYSVALRDKTKANVKGEIEAAAESLVNLRSCDAALLSTKKAYQHACDYQSRQFGKMAKANTDPAAGAKAKQGQLEAKIKLADNQLEAAKTDHQMAVKKHCDTLMEFQGKLLEACQKFESLEEEYLTRMTGFMGKMSDIQNSSHSQMGVVYSSFNEVIQEFSVNKLLSLFVESKGTGKTKPVPFKFRPLQAAPASLNASLVDVRPESPGHQRPDKERHDSASSSSSGSILGKAFKKLTKSKTMPSNTADSVPHETSTSPVPSVAVDEEGFSIRPEDASNFSKFPGDRDKGKQKSDSDSDSDPGEEPGRSKLKVIKINPMVAPGTATVDDIKASLQSIRFPGLIPSPQGGSTHSLDKLPSSSVPEHRKGSVEVLRVEKPLPDPLQSLLDLDHVTSVNIPPPLVPTAFNSEVFKATFADIPPLPDSMASPTLSLSTLPSLLEPLGSPTSAISVAAVFFGADSAPPNVSKAPASMDTPVFFLDDRTRSVESGLSDQGTVPAGSGGDEPAFFADFTSVAPPPSSLAPPPSRASSTKPADPSGVSSMSGQPSTNKLTTTVPLFPVDFSQSSKQEAAMVSQPSATTKLPAGTSLYSVNSGSSGSLAQSQAIAPPTSENNTLVNQPDPSSSISTSKSSSIPVSNPSSLGTSSPLLPPPSSAPLAFPPPPGLSRDRSGSGDLPAPSARSVPRPRLTVTTSKGSPDLLRRVDTLDEPLPPVPTKKRVRPDEIEGPSEPPTSGSQPTSGGLPPVMTAAPVPQRAAGTSMGVTEVSPLVTAVLKPGLVPAPPPLEVPIAVAFIETCNAVFKGGSLEQCLVKVTGDMAVSFPANYIERLQSSPPMQFRVTNAGLADKFVHHPTLLTKEAGGLVYSFVTDALVSYLKNLASKNPAPFYNLPVLKYDVKVSDATRLPLHLASYWKCEPKVTNFRLDYTYNPAAFNTPVPITSLSVCVPVNGGVVNTLSKPQAEWNAEQGKMVWKIGDLQPQGPTPASGSLHAKFDIQEGPSVPKPTGVQFVCEGVTLSGVGLDVAGSGGYRISLLKFKSISGQYSAEV
eukprot:Em0011g1026a